MDEKKTNEFETTVNSYKFYPNEHMNENKIAELEKRIKVLEEKLAVISFNEAKEINMTNCPIGEVHTGNNCNLNIQNCSIGSVIDTDLEDAEDKIMELEDRISDINTDINEADLKLNELEK